MLALKEYLREKAKFLSPGTGIKNPNPSSTDVKDYDFLFRPALDANSRKLAWSVNKNEYDARLMVHTGAVEVLGQIMVGLDLQRVLLEVKSPGVFDSLLTLLSRAMINPICPKLEPRRPTCEAAINKMCLYMASHKARWGAITSHEKWVFLRLHPGEQPYITFSSVELQENNTRPFCALLAMILAAKLNLEVESHANMQLTLKTIDDDDEESESTENSSDADPREDENVSFRGSGRVTREEPPVTRPGNRAGRTEAGEEPDLMIGWSQHTVAKPRRHAFYKLGYSDAFLSLGTGTMRLSLLRLLGSGSTGIVYQATLDSDQVAKDAESHLYAAKIVQKDVYHEKNGCIARLHHEFKVYSKIAQLGLDISPKCYGLYESTYMLALILDYGGEALALLPWSSYSVVDRHRQFELVFALHKIGIVHSDLEPRNIVRNSTGSLRIIDFSQAGFHKCPGIKGVPWKRKRRGGECAELKYM
ncbi:hypothetical protein ACEPAH_8581 [Sanghuangporus vaninii]